MRSILPKGESRKRRSIAVHAIACVLVALFALPFAGCSASPNATGGTAGSQEYTVSVSLSGGSGRASIASPTTIVKDGDTHTATITWSSSNYDKMTVDGVDYAPVNDGGNSTFEIPVTLDEDIAVSAETVAMSTPHTIDYTLHFDSSTMKEKSGDDASGGSPAGTASDIPHPPYAQPNRRSANIPNSLPHQYQSWETSPPQTSRWQGKPTSLRVSARAWVSARASPS